MSNCSSGCKTKDHQSYGECLQAKSLKIAYANSANGADFTDQKKWQARLNEYRDAKRQGIQPASAQLSDIRQAVKLSDQTGQAFRADA